MEKILLNDVVDLIDQNADIKTIEVHGKEFVRVVRCWECKHYIADGCDECQLMIAKSIIAGINNKQWYSEFYCAWGEREEDDNSN